MKGFLHVKFHTFFSLRLDGGHLGGPETEMNVRAQKYSSACKNEKDVLRNNQFGVERSFYKIN